MTVWKKHRLDWKGRLAGKDECVTGQASGSGTGSVCVYINGCNYCRAETEQFPPQFQFNRRPVGTHTPIHVSG